jgi:hypothetical protein
MRSTMLSAAALALAVMTVAMPREAPAAELITNGGFESGFTAWTRADQLGSEGTFFIQTGTASPVNGFTVPPPPQGVQAAMTDAMAGGSHVLYQDFVVPVTFNTAVLSFMLFVNNLAGEFFTPGTLDWATPTLNQQARVDIVSASADPFSVAAGDVLLNAFATAVGDPATSGYLLYTIDLATLFSANAGQTLRLRFAEVDNVLPFNLGVDDVRIAVDAAAVPEPGTLLLGLAALLALAPFSRLRARRATTPRP